MIREHRLLIGIPVAAVPRGIPLQAEGYSSFEAVRGLRAVNRGCDVSTTDLGFHGAGSIFCDDVDICIR